MRCGQDAPMGRTRSPSWRTRCTNAGSPGWCCRVAQSADASCVRCAASTAKAVSARAATSTAAVAPAPAVAMLRESCPAVMADRYATPATAAIPIATKSASDARSRDASLIVMKRVNRGAHVAIRVLDDRARPAGSSPRPPRALTRVRSARGATRPSSPSGNAAAAGGSGRSAGARPTTRQICATRATQARRTPVPDAAGSPRERVIAMAIRSVRAATSVHYIAATSAVSSGASRHGGRAARSVPHATRGCAPSRGPAPVAENHERSAQSTITPSPSAPNAQDLEPATSAPDAAVLRIRARPMRPMHVA